MSINCCTINSFGVPVKVELESINPQIEIISSKQILRRFDLRVQKVGLRHRDYATPPTVIYLQTMFGFDVYNIDIKMLRMFPDCFSNKLKSNLIFKENFDVHYFINYHFMLKGLFEARQIVYHKRKNGDLFTSLYLLIR